MSFSYDYTVFDADGTVDQGTLASSYTNALSAYLQGDGADLVAFLSYVAAGSTDVDAALALKAQVEAGNFSLSGLFSAAQSKTGVVDGSAIAEPTPTVSVMLADGSTVTVDLTGMLTGLDTETWTTLTQVKKTTTTIYHTREFYSDSTEPQGYADDWSTPQNEAPTARPVVWNVNEYDDEVGTDGTQVQSIDLLVDAHADDPENQLLTVTFDENQLPPYVTYVDGKLVINTDDPALDQLYKGEELKLSFTYEISDGTNTIPNTVDVMITGTNDLPTAQAITWDVTEYNNYNTADSEPAVQTVDLLQGANDVDGDVLSVFAGSVMLSDGSALPSYLTVDYTNGTVSIDTSGTEFNALYLNGEWTFDITYQITDGNGEISNPIGLTITGTLDEFHTSTSVTVAKGDAVSDSGSIDLLGDYANDAVVDVSGSGDFDRNIEGFTVTGDVDSTFSGAATTGNAENNFINVNPTQALNTNWSTDGDLDYSVSFTDPVDGYTPTDPDASVVKIELTYDYWM